MVFTFVQSNGRKLGVLLIVCVTLFASSCKQKPSNPEAQVRALIAQTEALVESRNLSDLKPLIADDYRDGKGMKKRQVVALLQMQFLRKKSIHLLTRIVDLNVEESGESATAAVLVAMAGQAVESVNALKGIRADLMKLNFRLKRDGGDWLVIGSTWRRARVSDFISLATADEPSE
ncbi:MAG: hypothetical protein VX589_10615 [Myxococcota bacterium]|nr:hypothetical protein [Myxococcota bacterium]